MRISSLIGMFRVAFAAMVLLLAACSDNTGSDESVSLEPETSALAESSQEQTASQPNILLIISDDFGVDVTSDMYPGLIDGLLEQYGPNGHNHPEFGLIDGHPASIPNLAKFASESMVFTNVWAHPFCSPTRASLLTGLYGAKTEVLSYADPLNQTHTSFVQLLKDEGNYSTAVFGKWHMSGLLSRNPEVESFPGMKPKEAGFDIFKGNLNAAIPLYWDYPYQIQDEDTVPGEWREEEMPVRSLPGIEATNFAPVVKVADTLDWITEKESEDPDKPWFVWFATNLSHATSIQEPSAMAIPNKDTMDEITIAEVEACGGEYGTNNTGECSGEALMRFMTNSFDTIIGKLVEGVDELDPNTYIIFVGDNGTPMYARPNLDHIDNLYISKVGRGKGTSYEGGSRVPMAVRGPGINPGTRSTQFAHAADLFSTVLELADLNIPEQVNNSTGDGTVALDAVSLAPLLFEETRIVRDPNIGYVLTESLNLMTGDTRQVGARNATYKVICTENTNNDSCEFYNLIDDPIEEYPLEKPGSCAAYQDGSWGPGEEFWHYCRLNEVVANESFFSKI